MQGRLMTEVLRLYPREKVFISVMMRKIRVDFLAKLNKCNYTNLFPVIKSQYKARTINKSLAMTSNTQAPPFSARGRLEV